MVTMAEQEVARRHCSIRFEIPSSSSPLRGTDSPSSAGSISSFPLALRNSITVIQRTRTVPLSQ
jgi:hypothetical protein